MAILVRSIQSRRTGANALLLLAILSGAGCLVLDQLGWMDSGGRPFSHEGHDFVEELECMDCHASYEDEEHPGWPALDDCLICHEDGDTGEPDPRVSVFFPDGEFVPSSTERLAEEVIFSHRAHVTDEQGCADCHEQVAHSDWVKPWMAMDMEGCVDCHADAGLSANCASCHEEIRSDVAPWTHAETWPKNHGTAVRHWSDQTVDRCELCHQESTCTTCHQTDPPDNHDNFWRRQGHGLTASIDRQNCATCHRQDYCDRCHENVTPVSHRGLWGGSRSTHCYGCHISAPQQGCFLCHKGTPSHLLAPPKPPGHDPASDCRSCHLWFSHVDKGDNCNLCHQ